MSDINIECTQEEYTIILKGLWREGDAIYEDMGNLSPRSKAWRFKAKEYIRLLEMIEQLGEDSDELES